MKILVKQYLLVTCARAFFFPGVVPLKLKLTQGVVRLDGTDLSEFSLSQTSIIPLMIRGRQCKSIGGTNVGFLALLLSIQGEVNNCRLTSNGSILY